MVNPMHHRKPPSGKGYPEKPLINKAPIPDPFAMPRGRRIGGPAEWPGLAASWRKQILQMEYGGLPPAPEALEFETLSHSVAKVWPEEPMVWSYRLHVHGGTKPFTFTVQVLFPNDREGPFPALVNGDGCWRYLADPIAQGFLGEGIALVQFNRTELAEDLGYAGVPDKSKRSGGLYDLYPGCGFGAVAAWAWGYLRAVDLLQTLPFIDPSRIGISGHSRGGKTTLVAGAADPRISLVNDNASCAGGSALFRFVGDGGETIDILNQYPSWFGADLRQFLDREEEIPFDQHCLLATIAPRPLLVTYSLEDRWSNPEGMVQCVEAAREVYRFLGHEEHLAYHLRNGPHLHHPEDWRVLLDFMKWKWFGQPPAAAYNQNPYGHLQPMYSWTAPGS